MSGINDYILKKIVRSKLMDQISGNAQIAEANMNDLVSKLEVFTEALNQDFNKTQTEKVALQNTVGILQTQIKDLTEKNSTIEKNYKDIARKNIELTVENKILKQDNDRYINRAVDAEATIKVKNYTSKLKKAFEPEITKEVEKTRLAYDGLMKKCEDLSEENQDIKKTMDVVGTALDKVTEQNQHLKERLYEKWGDNFAIPGNTKEKKQEVKEVKQDSKTSLSR